MNRKINIGIIVPVYNETTVIAKVIDELLDAGYSDIIIVDDGSEKQLHGIICDKPVCYLRHVANLGQGAALQTGIKYALQLNADVIVTFDGDGQHDAGDISALLDPVISGECDVALGSRFLNRMSSNISFTRLLLLKSARIVNFMFSGIYLSDAHNGLRVLSRKSAELINITENRMAHASEILFEIKRHRLNHKEIPVNVKYTTYSQGKGQSGWGSIRILLDIVICKIYNWFV